MIDHRQAVEGPRSGNRREPGWSSGSVFETQGFSAPLSRSRDIIGAINPHLPPLRRFARKLTRNVADADDLVQDCLERAIRQWHQLRAPSALKSWLHMILYNAWVSNYRRASRLAEYPASDRAELELSSPAEQEHGLLARDVLSAVDRLTPGQRDVVRLVAIESLSYREAANVLSVPVGTVMSRLSRARLDLRHAFAI